jgi:hypothetical protein
MLPNSRLLRRMTRPLIDTARLLWQLSTQGQPASLHRYRASNVIHWAHCARCLHRRPCIVIMAEGPTAWGPTTAAAAVCHDCLDRMGIDLWPPPGKATSVIGGH